MASSGEARYFMSKAFASLYVAAVLALGVCAVLIWRMRCEGFGCMGIGVAWVAWVQAAIGMTMFALWVSKNAA